MAKNAVSYLNRVPGWLQLAELPYGRLRADCLKHHEEMRRANPSLKSSRILLVRGQRNLRPAKTLKISSRMDHAHEDNCSE